MTKIPQNKFKLSFFGGAQEVTGANYLLETESNKVLVDCGLFQGQKINEDKNDNPFPYDPASIDALFITHTHLDHIGRVPKLVKEGFKGKIFSTLPTRDLSQLTLIDSLGVMEKEAKRNKKEKIIYSEKDVEETMKQWEIIDYHNDFKINDLKIIFREAGHILGSAMVEIIVSSPNSQKIVFTGDLGNSPNPLLKDMEKITDANYFVIESTYGDREHEELDNINLKLERIIEDTVKAKGVLMIPAFSIERTQKLLFEINDLVEHGRIPNVPIFLDSPLAIKATDVYKKYQNYFNEKAKEIIRSGDELFNFPNLKMTLTTEESKSINDVPAPKIIMAGSGMSIGGRIIHHERRYLPDSRNTLLLVSYQSAGSLGRYLQEGAKTVNILGEIVPVRARIENIQGYSAHPDIEKLFDFVRCASKSLEKVFVVQGELKASLFFVQRLRDYLGVDALAPKLGDSFEF
jgi:metallo-beta-lactamase family protein